MVKGATEDWLSRNTWNFFVNFFASLLAGVLLLFITNEATSPQAIKNVPEPLKTTLQRVHGVSSDIVSIIKITDKTEPYGKMTQSELEASGTALIRTRKNEETGEFEAEYVEPLGARNAPQ